MNLTLREKLIITVVVLVTWLFAAFYMENMARIQGAPDMSVLQEAT